MGLGQWNVSFNRMTIIKVTMLSNQLMQIENIRPRLFREKVIPRTARPPMVMSMGQAFGERNPRLTNHFILTIDLENTKWESMCSVVSTRISTVVGNWRPFRWKSGSVFLMSSNVGHTSDCAKFLVGGIITTFLLKASTACTHCTRWCFFPEAFCQ